MSFTPYLFFGGDCREAFTRYQEIFGGQLEVMTMADVPPSDDMPPGGDPDTVMHAALTIDGALLMGSDDPTGGYEGPRDIRVAHTASDVAEANRVFGELAEGGEVALPISETFFSPAFGMCTDRFGIPWMVDTAPAGD